MSAAPNRISPARGVAGIAAALALAAPIATGLVTHWEGKSNVVYLDGGGVPTVCYGHTGPDVRMGQPKRSDAQCDVILKQDMQSHGQGLAKCLLVEKVPTPLTGAFWSWTINVGETKACGSTAVKLANQGNYAGACVQLSRWTYDNGVYIKGLANRRADERSVCEAYR